MKICVENDEDEKYLLTFQNMLTRIPRWNNEILDAEVERLKEDTNCKYLEDLITCVHVTQLKILSCVRVGDKNKRIDIDIPSLKEFVHKIYIEVARKFYKNVYLFQQDVVGIVKQKNARIAELIIRECIFEVIRDSMPIEELLRAYLDETQEEIVEEEEVVEEREIPQPVKEDTSSSLEQPDNVSNQPTEETTVSHDNQTLRFDNTDHVVEFDKTKQSNDIPQSQKEYVDKSIEQLEKQALEREEQTNYEDDDSEDEASLKIENDINDMELDLGIQSLDEPQPIDLGDMDDSEETDVIRLNF